MVGPRMLRIRQKFEAPRLDDIPGEVDRQLAKLQLGKKIKPGQTVAITVGSRGIANIARITKAIVDHLQKARCRADYRPGDGKPRRRHGRGTAADRRRLRRHRGLHRRGDPLVDGDGDRRPHAAGHSGPFRQARLRGRPRASSRAASSRTPGSSARSNRACTR